MSSRTKQVRVSRVAGWAGWCSPCESEGRPLVLTRTGPTGLGAWLAGLGDDDRFLLLACNVCGHWQVVPPREQDDPQIVLVEDEVREAVLEAVAEARTPVPVPAPRAAVEATAGDAPSAVIDLTAVLEVPPACVAVPAPRRAGVLMPETAPAFSPEAIAAATDVLAAARAQTQRTAPRAATPRPAPLDRSRRTRNSAAARRTDRPAAARVARPAVATSIALPIPAASQLVVAAAR